MAQGSRWRCARTSGESQRGRWRGLHARQRARAAAAQRAGRARSLLRRGTHQATRLRPSGRASETEASAARAASAARTSIVTTEGGVSGKGRPSQLQGWPGARSYLGFLPPGRGVHSAHPPLRARARAALPAGASPRRPATRLRGAAQEATAPNCSHVPFATQRPPQGTDRHSASAAGPTAAGRPLLAARPAPGTTRTRDARAGGGALARNPGARAASRSAPVARRR